VLAEWDNSTGTLFIALRIPEQKRYHSKQLPAMALLLTNPDQADKER
jgi:hypothetical protein